MSLPKKVVWNALSSYFLIFVSLAFLRSSDPNLNHPFVKNHVKVAFILHLLLGFIIFLMSYPFFDSIYFFDYSLNTIITIILLLSVFTGIIYGGFQAYQWKTLTLWEMLRDLSWGKKILQESSTKHLWEEHALTLVLAHIPFIWYVFAGRHPDLPHMRNITMLNMIVTCMSSILASLWSISLASIVMLLYIIWSVLQSIRLMSSHELQSLNIEKIPIPREKIILQKSFLIYFWNSLRKKTFIPFSDIKESENLSRQNMKQDLIKKLSSKKQSSLPKIIYYIPFINLIWIFFLSYKEQVHIKNGLILTFIIFVLILTFGINSPLLLLTWIPLCYGIWNLSDDAYLMPYVYDISESIWSLWKKLSHIGRKTKQLHNTEKKVTIKIGEKK